MQTANEDHIDIATVDEQSFTSVLRKYLSPSSAIQMREFLHGRTEQLDQIHKALASSGRTVFVYGDRGVGKTSLAQTAAFLHQSPEALPVIVACDKNTTFFALLVHVASRLRTESPTKAKTVVQAKLGLATPYGTLSAEISRALEEDRTVEPRSVSDALGLVNYYAIRHSRQPVIVIDEFDRISSNAERSLFGDFVKQVGDQGIGAQFIFCGVGQSLTDLLAEHESAYRYIAGIPLERLHLDALMEIISVAAEHLQTTIDKYYLRRIAVLSDGFPHFAHLIGTKLFWRVFEDGSNEVRNEHFTLAISDAIKDVEQHLRVMYEKATQAYSDYKAILWAVADHPDLERRSQAIHSSYLRIMKELKENAVDRPTFNNRINALKTQARGSVLIGSRQGWYRFREPVLRGYCRLRAADQGVILDREHALAAPRIRTT